MELGFEETQTPYESGSQSARVWTETWLKKSVFCPSCGAGALKKFPNNQPAADFHCNECREEFELKSQKTKFGAKVLDGAYKTLTERVTASNNPNFFFLNYDSKRLSVDNLFVVPKHFFVPTIVEERKPLAPTARRAGWVGCNILLGQIPDSGKIFIVRNRTAIPKDEVLSQWRRTSFLKDETLSARGWLLDVLRCVELIGKTEFMLSEVYAFEETLQRTYPGNQHVRQKIRQQLQFLRDRGVLKFLSRGRYCLL